jgi:hypothetical protein
MATEISRTFDLAHGAVVVQIKDQFNAVSFHTLYLSGVPDVDATVAQLLTDTDTAAAVIRDRMIKAGWVDTSAAG